MRIRPYLRCAGRLSLLPLILLTLPNVRAGSATWNLIPTSDAAPADFGGNLVTPRSYHTATRLPDGRVLLAGGYDNQSKATSSTEFYSLASNSWTPTGDLNSARYLHSAVLLNDGRVLVAGGTTPGGSGFKSVEIYNPATGIWTYTSDMLLGRFNFDAVTLSNGKVLVAGGVVSNVQSAEAEIYDPDTGLWSVTGSLVHERSSHHVTLLPSGKVLVAGGFNQSGSVLEAELYDPATGTFGPTGSLTFGRYQNIQALLADGRVLCAGGSLSSGNKFKALAAAELYDPATGLWTRTGSMRVGRFVFSANLLPDGNVFVAGGLDSSIHLLDSIEEYNPTIGKWRPYTSTLTHARDLHTGTTLLDGSVIIAGGAMATSEAELFVRPR